MIWNHNATGRSSMPKKSDTDLDPRPRAWVSFWAHNINAAGLLLLLKLRLERSKNVGNARSGIRQSPLKKGIAV